MNEILLVTQRRYKKEEELKPVLERTLSLANRLEKVLKEEDSTRVSTMAFHGSNSYNEVGLGNITDLSAGIFTRLVWRRSHRLRTFPDRATQKTPFSSDDCQRIRCRI
jgi:hypothetical protein